MQTINEPLIGDFFDRFGGGGSIQHDGRYLLGAVTFDEHPQHLPLKDVEIFHDLAHLLQRQLRHRHPGHLASIGEYQLAESHQKFTFVSERDFPEPFILIGPRPLENSELMAFHFWSERGEISFQKLSDQPGVIPHELQPSLGFAAGALFRHHKNGSNRHRVIAMMFRIRAGLSSNIPPRMAVIGWCLSGT